MHTVARRLGWTTETRRVAPLFDVRCINRVPSTTSNLIRIFTVIEFVVFSCHMHTRDHITFVTGRMRAAHNADI